QRSRLPGPQISLRSLDPAARPVRQMRAGPVADRQRGSSYMAGPPPIASVMASVVGPGMPIAFEAYDGSTAGPADAVTTIRVVDPRALNHLATAPGELGLARAYVAGHLDIDGDTYQTLVMLARENVGSLTWPERIDVLRQL